MNLSNSYEVETLDNPFKTGENTQAGEAKLLAHSHTASKRQSLRSKLRSSLT